MASVRPAAVAGMFYPAAPRELAREVDDMLAHSAASGLAPGFPKALIVPHAGYVYSGSVAAEAYERLRPARGIVRRVVLLGPCHRVAVRGLALPEAVAFATPLGQVPIDQEAVKSLAGLPQVVVSKAVHAEEHALEVQLPFLQRVLGEFSLVPLAVGAATAEQVAEVLDRLWGGAETLLVISSDLSHYHPYEEACAIDRGTARAILDYSPDIDHEQACGATPVAGMLLAARRHKLNVELLDLRNSGDTAGDRGRVVGYASFAFWDGAPGFGDAHGRTLLAIARNSIEAALDVSELKLLPDEPWLRPVHATFVTLMRNGALRGCIGSLEAHRPLGEDVRHNARAAALSDPRFPPLSREELASTRIEISLLSTPELLAFADHAGLIAQLRPGEDGLILECGDARGTFLPQVWESLPDPEKFVAELKRKAGLLPSVSTVECRIQRYRVLKWKETAWKDEGMSVAESQYPARWWHMLEDGRMQCDLCPRDCRLHEGQRGLCFVRLRQGEKMLLTTYGRSSGFCVDPIEKKPLNQFYPGSSVLSFGTAGCNLACKFCQNWDISKSRDMDSLADAASPEVIAQAAQRLGCKSVAFTYNDPVIFAEYAMDVADACHSAGVQTVAVTAGYIHAGPRREFYAKMDAANVDLKGFTDEFYVKLTGSRLAPVLDTLKYLKHETGVWFEITTLLIPGKNDSDAELDAECAWIARELGPDVPLHFSAFHPDWKMTDIAPTPAATLTRARRIALSHGLHYVYTGNVHDTDGGTTSCPHCGTKLIVRDWYNILDYRVSADGHCKKCGGAIAGRYQRFDKAFGSRRIPVRLSALAS